MQCEVITDTIEQHANGLLTDAEAVDILEAAESAYLDISDYALIQSVSDRYYSEAKRAAAAARRIAQ